MVVMWPSFYCKTCHCQVKLFPLLKHWLDAQHCKNKAVKNHEHRNGHRKDSSAKIPILKVSEEISVRISNWHFCKNLSETLIVLLLFEISFCKTKKDKMFCCQPIMVFCRRTDGRQMFDCSHSNSIVFLFAHCLFVLAEKLRERF